MFCIVFEGQPFIEGCLKAMLRQADFVSVVEGATNREAQHLGNGIRITGHPDSQDGTREILKEYQEKYRGKLTVQFANGKFWRSKTQMVQNALGGCRYGVLMQVDIDEFWHDWQIAMIKKVVSEGDYSDLEFHCRHYWASPHWHVALSKGLWGGGDPWRRAFLWNGEPVESHEPPRFRRRWEHVLTKEETRALGLVFFHGSYASFENVRKKELFYNLKPGELTEPMLAWARKGYGEVGPPGPMVNYQGPFPPDWPQLKEWI